MSRTRQKTPESPPFPSGRRSVLPRPPRLAEWLLGRLFPDRRDYSTVGDLAEEFQARAEARGAFRARLWYRLELAKALPYVLKDILYWKVSMIRNYLVIALRLIRRHKVYSFINVAGLAALFIAWLTVAFQTLRSARTNPVEALRFE